MYQFIKVEKQAEVAVLTLDRPEVLNAWHAPMRNEIAAALGVLNGDQAVRAIVITGAGDRAFSAGQDLSETKTFDPDRAALWIDEWRALYGVIRDLDKPLVAALNGVAAGSAFLMQGMLGLSRTIELTLTGRMMDGEECHAVGLVHYLVPQDQVMDKALEVARLLAAKPPVAMRLDKRRFREVTQPGFDEALAAGVRTQREAYASGEPQAMMARFFAERAKRRSG
jgi:enoyl-CoA hydratase/carnithine racemase